MDAREFIIAEVRKFCCQEPLKAEFAGFTWDDNSFLRTCLIRLEHGDETAWSDFISRLLDRRSFASAVWSCLERYEYLIFDVDNDRPVPGLPPRHCPPEVDAHFQDELESLMRAIESAREPSTREDEPPSSRNTGRTEIMYIEQKPGLIGPGRIGRVKFSKTGKTIYYDGRRFRSLKGGYKCNYFDVDTEMDYWISGCRSDGRDTLYPGIVEIDDDVREEYWRDIRRRPGMIATVSFRSEGKYSKRSPV